MLVVRSPAIGRCMMDRRIVKCKEVRPGDIIKTIPNNLGWTFVFESFDAGEIWCVRCLPAFSGRDPRFKGLRVPEGSKVPKGFKVPKGGNVSFNGEEVAAFVKTLIFSKTPSPIPFKTETERPYLRPTWDPDAPWFFELHKGPDAPVELINAERGSERGGLVKLAPRPDGHQPAVIVLW